MKSLHVLIVLMLLTACGSGEFNNHVDPLYQRYGLEGLSLTQGGGVIGLVSNENGSSAAGVEVQLRSMDVSGPSSIVSVYTNSKGGFYIKGIKPGDYRLLVLGHDGTGFQKIVKFDSPNLMEMPDITLKEMSQLSGRVTVKSEVEHDGVTVSLEGTPFVTTTNKNGLFTLQAPAGIYPLRIRKDLYTPIEVPEFDLTQSETQDFTLEPMPWPDGTVTIANFENGLVRSLETELSLTWTPSVRFMRVTTTYQDTIASSSIVLNAWIPVEDKVRLTFKTAGWNEFQILLRDAWGKVSDPIHVSVYNTTYDKTWRLFYGEVRDRVTIKAGEKVAFIGIPSISINTTPTGATTSTQIPQKHFQAPRNGSPSFVDTGVSDSASSGTSASTGTSNQSSSGNSQVGVEFLGPVVIEGGALIEGSAMFVGPLTIKGTQDQPVIWDLKANEENLGWTDFLNQTDIQWAQLIHGYVSTLPSISHQEIHFSHVQLKDVSMDIRHEVDDVVNETEWYFNHTTILGGYLTSSCPAAQSGEVPENPTPPATIAEKSRIRLDLQDSVVSETSLMLKCFNSKTREVSVTLKHNNFFGFGTSGYTFEFSHKNQPPAGQPNSPAEAFPDQTDIVWDVLENYFEKPDKLYDGMVSFGWPDAILGPNLTAARTDIGY